MRSAFICLAVLIYALGAFGADTMVVSRKENKGTFKGFKDGEFVMELENGDSLSEKQTKVTKLTLENPTDVQFLKKGKSDYQEAQLTGYGRLKFSFEIEGKKTQIARTSVKEIRVNTPMGETGTEIGEAPKEIPAIDVSRVEDDPELTETQKTALANYKSARAKYDAFLSESTALMAKADAADGGDRAKILNQLRSRKDAEQPVRSALLSAQNTLRAAFPKDGGEQEGAQEEKPAEDQAE